MRAAACSAGLLLGLLACACARTHRPAEDPGNAASAAQNRRARALLCGDIGEATCLAACPATAPPREHTECLIDLRFRSDPAALELARALYANAGTVPGVSAYPAIEGFKGQEVELFPALPVGEHRHHLAWLQSSLESFAGFVEALSARASKPVDYETRPAGFAFFRTAVPSYPSAFCLNGVIGYNLDGPLHTDQREMHETLVHELFHLNDAKHDDWSRRVLRPIFDSIVDRCDSDHECLRPFSPHTTTVPDGTYYAFDARTRDVREYGAELAVRYFLEHEAILAGEEPRPPFKCGTRQNRVVWSELASEFFGGVDLTPDCAESASIDDSAAKAGEPRREPLSSATDKS